MQYITTKRYKGNGIGNHFNLPYATPIEEKDGVLYHDNKPICVARSLNGKKHFASNEDGQGLKRGELTYFIAYSNRQKEHSDGHVFRFSEEEIEKRMDAILEFADIGDYVYQPVKTYSSGMFVRLAFAVAINIDPEILIVDEALSVGDVFFQAKCYHKFEEFKKKGKTILFVSHDLSSISKYCDRAVLLNQGVLI
jgi:ABC-type Na+ transport system ATPase subunit NatA